MKSTFSEKCYNILKKVPRGKITTYKLIAEALNTRAYRVVGTAMKNNPYAPKVPCHRVINSNGKIGKFASGINKKISLLKKEGIPIKNNKIPNMKRYLYRF